MADKIKITPAELESQAARLTVLTNQMQEQIDKSSKALALIEDSLSILFSKSMDSKGNALLKKLKNLRKSLKTGAEVASKCATTYENADKVLRDTMGDSLPDNVVNVPVSNQTVLKASGPLEGNPRISSNYGPRNLYGSFHYGTDFAVPTGTPVQSVVSGTVIAAYTQSGGGNCIYLLGDDGYLYEYAHLSSFSCKQGDRIEAGQMIAKSGATGQYVTGAHLHFGVFKADQALKNVNNLGSSNLKWQQTSDGQWFLGGSVDPIQHLANNYDIHY